MTQATPDTDLAERLRFVVTRLARRLRQQSDDGVSPTQRAALATVEQQGPITLGALAAAERVTPPTMTAAVTRLETDGLIVRHTDPDDRRVVRVEISAAGRKLLARSRSRKTAELDRRLRRLSSAERATLEDAVGVLHHLFDDESPAAREPRR